MKQFIRNFRKQKTVGTLNILGLSLGVMCAIIVGLWGFNEFSFDTFHQDGHRIYRAVNHMALNDKPVKVGSTFKPLGEEAMKVLPDIEQQCRVVYGVFSDLVVEEKLYQNNDIITADSNFFSFFTFPLVEGHLNNDLLGHDEVVISERAAAKLFPDKSAINEVVNFVDQSFRVAAIMQNMPSNSHLQADFVFPFFGYFEQSSWGWSDMFITYLHVRESADIQRIEKELAAIYTTNMSQWGSQEYQFKLEALKDIHFGTGFMSDFVVKGNKYMVVLFIITVLVILVISCMNFANLFVSTSFKRAKTIGVKKAQGADRKRLVFEFYRETACYVLISVLLGLFLAYFSYPFFNQALETNFYLDFTSPHLYLFLFGLSLFTILIAGSFPALYMTRFGIIDTLFGRFRGKRISILQKILVVFQFTASITLLIIVFFFNKQINHMLSADLGFNKENVISVYASGDFGRDFDVLKDDLMKDPAIIDMTVKNSMPTLWQQGWGVRTVDSNEDVLMERCMVKSNYFDFFEMSIIEGVNPFDRSEADSLKVCVINEAAAKDLGLDDPVGTTLVTNNRDHVTVAGVIKDTQVRSFHKPIDPQVYYKLNWNKDKPISYPIFFKIEGNPQKAIQTIEKKWNELVHDRPFEYIFLDDTYARLYKSETNTSKMLTYAMIIASLIALTGLFAMAYYSTMQRVKEIAIRKVNGATIADLLSLLNKDFIFWIAISFLIASPLSYFFVKNWLKNFTIQTHLSMLAFIVVGLIALLATLITVSWQSYKAATANPVDALKTE